MATIELLSKRHLLQILYTLRAAPLSFTALYTELGVNTATLTKRIKEMEQVKLITQLTCPKDTRKSYYILTEKGQMIAQIIATLPMVV